MMKKILFSFCLAIFAMTTVTKAQSTATLIPVVDTLHYYFNKHYFKTGTPMNSFPFYKSAAATSTVLTHVGSKFENKDALVVTGLEAFAMMGKSTSQLTIKVNLYLCNLDGNKMPIIPAIDSVETTVSKAPGASIDAYMVIGGNFKASKSYTLNNDYAVLFRNMSTVKGDTVRLMRTAGMTYTAWPNVSWNVKYSDSYGVARNLGTFVSTKNLNLPVYGFTYGTDYEFCVAPRVQYTLTADHLVPNEIATQQTVCTFQPLTYQNTSSFQFTHRMFNLLEFYKKWSLLSPFQGQPVNGGWPADSSITWNFLDFDNTTKRPDSRTFLPYGGGTNQIIHYSDSVGCFQGCQFRANLRSMRIYGRNTSVPYRSNQDFELCVDYCNGDAQGIANHGVLSQANLYPNPTINGKVTISGLKGNNRIEVYDILGQVVLSEMTEQEKLQIDLSKQAKGNYFVRITNASNLTRAIKIQKLD